MYLYHLPSTYSKDRWRLRYRSPALPWASCWNPCRLSLHIPARRTGKTIHAVVDVKWNVAEMLCSDDRGQCICVVLTLLLTCTTLSCRPAVMKSSSVSTLRMKLARIGFGRSWNAKHQYMNSSKHSRLSTFYFHMYLIITHKYFNCDFCFCPLKVQSFINAFNSVTLWHISSPCLHNSWLPANLQCSLRHVWNDQLEQDSYSEGWALIRQVLEYSVSDRVFKLSCSTGQDETTDLFFEH